MALWDENALNILEIFFCGDSRHNDFYRPTVQTAYYIPLHPTPKPIAYSSQKTDETKKKKEK